MSFFGPEDGVRIHKTYEAAMLREVEKMCRAIPHDELAIQWDVAVETTAIEQGQAARIGGDMFDHWVEEVSAMGPAVPSDVALGYHICYGDFNHRHSVEPKDFSVPVRMLNEAATRAKRPLDFVHCARADQPQRRRVFRAAARSAGRRCARLPRLDPL